MKLISQNRTDYAISKTIEYIEFFVYCGLTFVMPFLIGGPQWLVGSLVNMLLVLAALSLDIKKFIPTIFLPSLGLLTRGAVFGQLTIFLVYIIPIIWVANTILVFGIKLKNKKRVNLLIGIIGKIIFIFLCTFSLIKLDILPSIFIKSMGLIQFYTATIGGILALAIYSIRERYFK